MFDYKAKFAEVATSLQPFVNKSMYGSKTPAWVRLVDYLLQDNLCSLSTDWMFQLIM